MKPRLAILDADAVIHLHELDRWEHVVTSCQVLLPETVARKECRFYEDEKGNRIGIRLEESILSGAIRVESASVAEVSSVQESLGREFKSLYEIHFGELEAMAILIREEKGHTRICTGDTAAIIALCCLDYGDNAVSVERLLDSCGCSANVERNFTEEALRQKLKRGKEFAIVRS